MNGLLLHLALAQARTHGNAVSGAQAGDGEKLYHFFSALHFLSLSACEAAARQVCRARLSRPSRAGRHCSISRCLQQHRPGLQTGARLGPWAGAACSDHSVAGWTGWGHHRPVPSPGLRLSTVRQQLPVLACLARSDRPLLSAVCSHLDQSCRELPALQQADTVGQAVTRE